VRAVLSDTPPEPRLFAGYDLRFYDDISHMRRAIRERDNEFGLARLVAGFAWPWASKRDKDAYDIVIDGVSMRWNSTDVDWVNAPNSTDEVGVIHTIQGYDLNYAGVIIGADLVYDAALGRMSFSRAHYFDPTAANNMPRRGIAFTDDDVLRLVQNIYAVLLTRECSAPMCTSATRRYVNGCAHTLVGARRCAWLYVTLCAQNDVALAPMNADPPGHLALSLITLCR
jgi:DUF2075 family protein